MPKRKKDDLMDPKKFRIHMQRESILRKLKEGGFRVTKQRIAVIDSILENDCGSCKEIFYKTAKVNKKIGAATIYRTINMLEEIGAINRRNPYMLSDLAEETAEDMVTIKLEDGDELRLTAEEWSGVLRSGLQACGYLDDEKIVSVINGTQIGA